MAELSDEIKTRIVTALARFEKPADIAKELVEEGISVDSRQIGGYDPTRSYFEAGDKWKVIFDAARQNYLTAVSEVPIANQGFRLQALQKAYELHVKRGNMVGAAAILRQAAEEVGGSLTNEKTLNVNKSPAADMSPEERQLAFAELIRKAMEGTDPPGTQAAPSATQ